MAVTITQATTVDARFLEAMDRLIPQLSSSWQGTSPEAFEAMVTHPAVQLLLAETEEGTIVGTLTLVCFPIPTGIRAWIEDVVVDGAARGLGAAKALVREAIDRSAAAGATTVDLTSRPSREAANQLYQAMGFEQRTTNVYRRTLEVPADGS